MTHTNDGIKSAEQLLHIAASRFQHSTCFQPFNELANQLPHYRIACSAPYSTCQSSIASTMCHSTEHRVYTPAETQEGIMSGMLYLPANNNPNPNSSPNQESTRHLDGLE